MTHVHADTDAVVALRDALDRGALHVCYQPQVDLGTGAIVGVEALARWTDPQRGVVEPKEFIALAVSCGLIVRLGELVLRTACEDSVRWRAAGLAPLRVAINLSATEIGQADVLERIQALLLVTGMDPNCLGVEITEATLLDDTGHVARTLTALKAIGVEISLDDFGSGRSSLPRLSELPLDVLKIDRAFVHEVTAAPRDVSITRALIQVAHGLQLKVHAEGVETEGQLALLLATRCDRFQGHHFSRAVPAAQIEAMLREGWCLAPESIGRKGGERTVLLVDDEANVLASLRRVLRKSGYRILTAASGEEGLLKLAANEVDVIVSDQRMPGMSGVEFLRRAKALCPETIRISLSGYTELQSVTSAINEGAIYKFLTKPWEDDALREHIAEAFRHKDMLDENRRLGEQVQNASRRMAEVNDRLAAALSSQLEQRDRSEAREAGARDVLESIPGIVIGVDDAGVIAFVSGDAQGLFGAISPLGRPADETLPEALHATWRLGEGIYRDVDIGARTLQAICTGIDQGGLTRGKVIVVTPRTPASAPA